VQFGNFTGLRGREVQKINEKPKDPPLALQPWQTFKSTTTKFFSFFLEWLLACGGSLLSS
jgi:hypothetical protein